VEEAAGITRKHCDALLSMAKKVEIRRIFEQSDLNGDGCIDRQELDTVIRKLCNGRAWTDEDISEIFGAVDLNGDGRIQYREFVEWVYSGDEQIKTVMAGLPEVEDQVSASVDDATGGGKVIRITVVEVLTREPMAIIQCHSSDTVSSLEPAVELQSGRAGPWRVVFERQLLTGSQQLGEVGIDDGASLIFIQHSEPLHLNPQTSASTRERLSAAAALAWKCTVAPPLSQQQTERKSRKKVISRGKQTESV
jgi:hypothetical protein